MESAQLCSNICKSNASALQPKLKKYKKGSIDTPEQKALSAEITKISSQKKARIFHDITLKNEGNKVRSIAFSPCSTFIAIITSQYNIKLWSILTKSYTYKFDVKKDELRSIVFSPDGFWLVTGSLNSSIIIWNFNEKSKEFVLNGHLDEVCSLAFSPNGLFIASGSFDKTVKIWNFTEKREEFTFYGHFGSVFSITFTPDCRHLVSGSNDNTVRIWDAIEKIEKMCLIQEVSSLTCVELSNDGKIIAIGNLNGIVKLWNLELMREEYEFFNSKNGIFKLRNSELKRKEYEFDNSNTVISVSFSKNGKLIVGHGSPFLVKLKKNSESGVFIWDVEKKCEEKKLIYNDPIDFLKTSPDNSFLVVCFVSGKISVLNLNIKREKIIINKELEHILCIASSPDGNFIATGLLNRKIKLWTVNKNPKKFSLIGHNSEVTCLLFLSDCNYLISGSNDSTIKIWNIYNKTEILTLTGHSKKITSISNSNSYLASGSEDKTIKIWNLNDFTEVNTLNIHFDIIKLVAISPDDKYLASASFCNRNKCNMIKIWNMKTCIIDYSFKCENNQIFFCFSKDSNNLFLGDTQWNIFNYLSGQRVKGKLIIFSIKESGFKIDCKINKFLSSSFSLSNDCRCVASVSRYSGLKIWNLHNNKKEFEGDYALENGNTLICFSNSFKELYISIKSKVLIRDFQKFREIGTIKKLGKYLYPIKFSKNGKYAANGHENKITIWVVKENKVKASFKAHLYWIRDLEFSHDSKFIVSGGDDNLVKVWDLDGNELMKFIGHLDWVLKVIFSRDGKYILSLSYDYSVKLWNIEERCENFSLNDLNKIPQSIALKGKHIAIKHKNLNLMVFKTSY